MMRVTHARSLGMGLVRREGNPGESRSRRGGPEAASIHASGEGEVRVLRRGGPRPRYGIAACGGKCQEPGAKARPQADTSGKVARPRATYPCLPTRAYYT